MHDFQRGKKKAIKGNTEKNSRKTAAINQVNETEQRKRKRARKERVRVGARKDGTAYVLNKKEKDFPKETH